MSENNKEIFLHDYTVPDYKFETLELEFNLLEEKTVVTSTIKYQRISKKTADLELIGLDLLFMDVTINGKEVDKDSYDVSSNFLTLRNLPSSGILKIKNGIDPVSNTSLEGLYKSGDIYCTQCEPEGFRKITYFLDRPDVMTKYTTKIIADKNKFPILLSNGNPIDRGELSEGKHFVTWEDPFNKPSYLFALVAGDLGVVKDTFTTVSKREIALEIYCDKGNESKCFHAMESLKKSMG